MRRLTRPVAMLSIIAALCAALMMSFASPTPAAAAEFGIGERVAVDTDALNVRTGPGLDEAAFFVAGNGLQATVSDGPIAADGYTWHEVSFDVGPNGWVAGEFLAPVSGGGNGFPSGTRIFVDTDALNVRSAAGLGNAVVNVLPYGYAAVINSGPVAADGYNWYRIDAMGMELGWVAGEFLSADGGGGFPEGTRVEVATDALNVRSQAGLGGSIVNVLPTGYVAFIVSGPVSADGYNWYLVEAMGVELGWVAGEYLAES